MDYREAGVDIAAGRAFVDRIRHRIASTLRPEVLGGLGGFSGLFQLPSGYREPVLVSATDGVGTKLKLAHSLDRHDTVGIDLVAMCVNDVLTVGAEPLFFLDYIATGHLDADQLAQVVDGIVTGCQQAGCSLLGGETAEMPGFYQPGEYDLAGFCVGIVEKAQILDGSQVQVGDVAIALASQGVHSNGFSLARKIIHDYGCDWGDRPEQTLSQSLGDELLRPTRIYVKPILSALKAGFPIHGMAHITGGGLPENLPRCLAPNQSVQIDLHSWTVPPIFNWLARAGAVTPANMFNTFNMGVGFVVLVPPDHVSAIVQHFQAEDLFAWAIAEVVAGSGEVLGLPS